MTHIQKLEHGRVASINISRHGSGLEINVLGLLLPDEFPPTMHCRNGTETRLKWLTDRALKAETLSSSWWSANERSLLPFSPLFPQGRKRAESWSTTTRTFSGKFLEFHSVPATYIRRLLAAAG